MPKFLTRTEIYKILQREYPEKTFATSSDPKDFYTTADDDSMAKTIETAYKNLERIYDNYFVHTAVEKINDWEITVFGEVDSSGATLEERRDKLLTKIRSQKGITKQDALDIVYSIIGSSKNVEIIEKGCESGAWILGKSRLSRNTYLGIFDESGGVIIPSDFDPCEDTPESIGITQEQLTALQNQAYSYEVRIIGYTATAEESAKIIEQLSLFGPARSSGKVISPFIPVVVKDKWKLGRSKLGSRTYFG